MKLNLIEILLNDEKIYHVFPDIVSLIKKRISEGEVCSMRVGKRKFSAEHFSDIYSSRLKWIEKKQMLKNYDGLEKTVCILSRFEGFLVVGSLDTSREHIVIFFSEDLKEIVALFKVSKG